MVAGAARLDTEIQIQIILEAASEIQIQIQIIMGAESLHSW